MGKSFDQITSSFSSCREVVYGYDENGLMQYTILCGGLTFTFAEKNDGSSAAVNIISHAQSADYNGITLDASERDIVSCFPSPY